MRFFSSFKHIVLALIIFLCSIIGTMGLSFYNKQQLSKFSDNNRENIDWAFFQIERLFYHTLELILDTIGDNAFYHNKQFNRSLFETLCISIARERSLNPRVVKQFYDKLVESDEFWQLSKSATTSKKNILSRLELAKQIIDSLGK